MDDTAYPQIFDGKVVICYIFIDGKVVIWYI